MKKYKLLSLVLSLVMALTVFSIPVSGYAADGDETYCLGNWLTNEDGESGTFFGISDGDSINFSDIKDIFSEKISQDLYLYSWDGDVWCDVDGEDSVVKKIAVTIDKPTALGVYFFDEEGEPHLSTSAETTFDGNGVTFVPLNAAENINVKVAFYDDAEANDPITDIDFKISVDESDVLHYSLGYGVYNQETDEDDFYYIENGDSIEFSAIGMDHDLSVNSDQYGDWSVYEAAKTVWTIEHPDMIGLEYYNSETEKREKSTAEQTTILYGEGVVLKPIKPGKTDISVAIFNEAADEEPIATVAFTLTIGNDDITQYRVGWWDDNDEATLLSPEETFDYENMGIASLDIYEKRPGEDWSDGWNPKMVWHSLNPDIAQLCYEGADNKYRTTGEDIELNDNTGRTVTVVPQSIGTAEFSVDVYDDEEAEKPVATVPMKIEITQKGLDRGRYEPYLRQCYAYEADYSKQIVYGETEDLDTYNKENKGEYPALTSDDLDKLKIAVTAGGKDYPATINKAKSTFTAKIANAKLGSYVKIKFTMGSYTWTDDLMVTQWIKPTYTVKTYTYNGRARKASVTVTYKGKALKRGTDYDFDSYSLKNVGRAKYSIWAIGGKYKFNYKEGYFKINPKGTTLKTPKRGKKQITVKWTRQATRMAKARITGYQIQLATNSKFTKGKKLVTVKGYKNTSKKIKKLKKKTKYFVRIRTYMKVGKYTYYSGWSKYKTVKTK